MENSSTQCLVTTFYQFKDLDKDKLADLRQQLLDKGEHLKLKGLLLIGAEGCNSTIAGLPNAISEFKIFVKDILEMPELYFKDSFADKNPFHRWKVKIRKEIVTLGTPELIPHGKKDHHLSPSDWHKTLQEEDVVVIDTRNTYETELGKFKTAIAPPIDNFQEFPEYVKNSPIEKDKKVLIYCTGGIRCEKAILEMRRQGYNNVYQLDGGIINYLKEYPNQEFEGECFVFDHRVCVDQDLSPSKTYKLCPHCGNPGNVDIQCIQCQCETVVCKHCLSHEEEKPEVKTCSKNCAHHYKLGHKARRPHLDTLRKKGLI